MLNKFLPQRLLTAIALSGFALGAQAVNFTVAYQTTVDPAKVAQADDAHNKLLKRNINWYRFADCRATRGAQLCNRPSPGPNGLLA